MIAKSLRAIYCDDIRNELGGKLSFMGVYSSDMILPSFPATLSKICAYITLTVPLNTPPKKSIAIRLLSGEAVIAEVIIDEASLESASLPPADLDTPEEERSLAIALTFVMAPLQVPEPMKIRLRAEVDGEELKGNALKIRMPTEDERKTLIFSA